MVRVQMRRAAVSIMSIIAEGFDEGQMLSCPGFFLLPKAHVEEFALNFQSLLTNFIS